MWNDCKFRAWLGNINKPPFHSLSPAGSPAKILAVPYSLPSVCPPRPPLLVSVTCLYGSEGWGQRGERGGMS